MVDIIQDNLSLSAQDDTNSENSKSGSRRGSNTSGLSRGSNKANKPPIPEAFPKDLIVSPPDKKYVCLKCDEILREPVQIKECGHRLCFHCYEDIRFGEESPVCPEDQNEFDRDTPPDIDKAFKREIEELQVKCKNVGSGCSWEGPMIEFQAHVKECDYEDILCEYDCGASYQRRYNQKHVDKECGKKIISCTYCNDRFLREDKKSHLEDCPKIPVMCPNKCDKKVTFPREELEKHITEECNRAKINCDFEDVCCEHKASREKMIKHYTKEITNHVRLLHDRLMKHDILLNQVKETVELHGSMFDQHAARIVDLERIAHSQLIWRIDEYSDKMKAAQSGEMTTLYSPGFITSKHGYRLSASVSLNGDGKGKGTHMSVFICILRGPYDALLKWPFDCRVTFTLLDQNSDPSQRKHLKFTIKPNPSPENAQFLSRPHKAEKNASFGSAKFAKHAEIESRNYIKDDTVFLKINIDTEGQTEPFD
ncbi:TNF receptor-associated factor 4 [Exaiptasia diaphana]|nr:TNF receptor-associated factor 4 [Exaiptasia diaphana]